MSSAASVVAYFGHQDTIDPSEIRIHPLLFSTTSIDGRKYLENCFRDFSALHAPYNERIRVIMSQEESRVRFVAALVIYGLVMDRDSVENYVHKEYLLQSMDESQMSLTQTFCAPSFVELLPPFVTSKLHEIDLLHKDFEALSEDTKTAVRQHFIREAMLQDTPPWDDLPRVGHFVVDEAKKLINDQNLYLRACAQDFRAMYITPQRV